MTPRITIGGAFAWSLAVFFVAGCVHLSSILLMPRLAPNDAFTRFAGMQASPGFALTAATDSSGLRIPFADSATLIATCRYDLTKGPVAAARDCR